MLPVDRETSVEELAALVSQALDRAGIPATLSGGGAVVVYSSNEYESCDLDFITNARNDVIENAIAPLGFRRIKGTRQFEHPDTDYYVEFPPGPLAFGEMVVADDAATTLETEFGPLRIVTSTQSVMDRLAAYMHWKDHQAFDQATMVARRNDIDWPALEEWARREGADVTLVSRLRTRSAPDPG